MSRRANEPPLSTVSENVTYALCLNFDFEDARPETYVLQHVVDPDKTARNLSLRPLAYLSISLSS